MRLLLASSTLSLLCCKRRPIFNSSILRPKGLVCFVVFVINLVKEYFIMENMEKEVAQIAPELAAASPHLRLN